MWRCEQLLRGEVQFAGRRRGLYRTKQVPTGGFLNFYWRLHTCGTTCIIMFET